VVWESSVFLTGSDGVSQRLYCWDSETGGERFTVAVGPFPGSPSELPDLSLGAGYAAPTPATDGERVYASFASGDLVCVDFEGRILWGQNIGYVEDPYGHSSSLLVFEDLLIVQYDHGETPFIEALDTLTGSSVWKAEREVYDTWSSPVLAPTDDGWQLIVNASPYSAAYDPRTGAELWRVEDILGEVASSPAYAGGRAILVNQLISILAVDTGSGETVWDVFEDLPDSSSPLAFGDIVIVATAYGVVTALDAATGGTLWKRELSEGFYASPVLAGGLVYLIDRAGVAWIVRGSETYELVGNPALGEAVDATPAFARGRIYLRGSDHLYCIGTGA
jgi:outer membrane protein assembly factor BamB